MLGSPEPSLVVHNRRRGPYFGRIGDPSHRNAAQALVRTWQTATAPLSPRIRFRAKDSSPADRPIIDM